MKKRIAIVGAGLSGLATGIDLAEAGTEVFLYDKSRGVTGRAASRTRSGCRYDHGANYFKADSEAVRRLLFERLPSAGLCRIGGDVRAFDAAGRIEPGDERSKNRERWTYRDGISSLGKLMVEVGGLKVRRETLVTRLHQSSGAWSLESELARFENFDAVLLTAPAPQAVALIGASDFDRGLRAELVEDLKKVTYHRQYSVILNVPGEVAMPGDGYALLNSDRQHDIAWMSLENRKPGRVLRGESLIVVQMSPLWTDIHFDHARDEIVSMAKQAVEGLLGSDLPELNWADCQRWRYAHPCRAADVEKLRKASGHGLFFAGDALVGKGRISQAIETGFSAARNIITCLEA